MIRGGVGIPGTALVPISVFALPAALSRFATVRNITKAGCKGLKIRFHTVSNRQSFAAADGSSSLANLATVATRLRRIEPVVDLPMIAD